jgi:hypothetical protein
LIILPLSLFCLENRVYLSHGVQVTGAAWRAPIRIVTGVENLVQRIEDGHTVQLLDDRTIEISGGAVCSLHRTRGTRNTSFLSLKTKVDGLSLVWPQNRW